MPTVASYCTTFLKPEMQHIYRQVTGLQRYQTFVVAKTRQHENLFPYADIEILGNPVKNPIKRFVRKYLQQKAALIYRGEYDAIMEVISRRQPDLLHIYFGHTGVHLLPFIVESKLPCLVSFHGADVMPREDRLGYEIQLRKLLQSIPLVLARSESLAERLQALGCPAEKIRINRTSIPLEEFTYVDRSLNLQPLRIVQACRLIEKKGLKTTLRAFADVSRKIPDARLSIAGEGPLLDELQALGTELGISDRLEFLGFLSQKQLRELYAASDIFLHPSEVTAGSDQEGVPNSMLEAMATGLPILATLHGGIPEAVRQAKDGFLVPEKNVPALSEALHRLCQWPDLRLEMGRSAAESVREKYDQTTQIQLLEGFYDELLSLTRG